MLSSPETILHLPDEILKDQVSRYLSLRDVFSLQSTCSQIEKSMSLKVIDNVELQSIEDSFSLHDMSDDQIFLKTIDPLFSDLSHTIIFNCDFKDQGWGNRKSFLYIKELDIADRSEIKSSGRTICSSPLAQHYWTKLRLEFIPQPGKVYSMWYKVGGGGGHALMVQNAKFQSLVFDPTGVCRKLANANLWGADPFFQRMFMAVVDTLLSFLERKDIDDENSLATQYPHFATLFESIGLVLTDDVKQVIAIKIALLDLKKRNDHLLN